MKISESNKDDMPDSNVVEVSLFGPGIGECLVIHVGNGDWHVVDSCKHPTSKIPIALEYFEKIGVDHKTKVKNILLSHFHEDHIGGAYKLVEACPNATIRIPDALASREVASLAKLYKKNAFSQIDSFISEYRDILELIKQEKTKNPKSSTRLQRIKQGDSINFSTLSNKVFRMVALSPSNDASNLAIANLLPKANETRNPFKQDENLTAIAIHLAYGDVSMLLGSDLEVKSSDATGWDNRTGWGAVLNSGLIDEQSISKSKIYKVPHHGSENGYHPQIWSELLEEHPLSITTPFFSSKLPNAKMIDKIDSLSSKFIITRNPSPKAKPKSNRPKVTERKLNESRRNRKSVDQMGHIRVRLDSDGNIDVKINKHCYLVRRNA